MSAAYVPCPLCKTPCSSRATTCDVCEQPLDRAPDLAALATERQALRSKVALAGVASLAVLVASLVLFRGFGFFLIVPGVSLGNSFVRYRELTKVLAANRPTSF